MESLKNTHIVITPNQRLTAYLLEKNEIQEQSNGAWPTPQITSLSLWIQQLYRYLFPDMQQSARLLTALQEQQLWRQVIENDNHVFLTDPWTLTKQIQQAWEFIHLWRIPESELQAYYQEDYQWFITLSQQFKQLCQEKNLFTNAELPCLLAEQLEKTEKLPWEKIILFAFDEITPAIEYLFEKMTTLNVKIETLAFSKQAQSITALAYQDSETEITAMATWAHQQYQQGKKRIACVVPNLMQNRKKINRIFNDIFFPNRYFGFQKLHNPFTITGGYPLLNQSAIQTVIAILSACQSTCHFEDINHLLLTPYLAAGMAEQTSRALFAANIRDKVFSKTKLSTIAYRLEKFQDCPEMMRLVDIMLSYKSIFKQTAPINQWIVIICELLAALGWPGNRVLSSHEYQQVSKFKETLNLLTELNEFSGNISFNTFFELLKQSLQQQLFQPQAKTAPVQILGLLEAAGQEFDAIWLMDLTNNNWPASASPNPFLPIDLQKRYNLPHSSADKELAFAEKMQNRLINSCEQMIFSWPETEGESHLSPSTLIMPYISNQLTVGARFISPAMSNENTKLETTTLTPIPLTESEFQADSGLIKKQAECTFQAFAHYRLKAKPLEKITFQTNKKLRGILVHQVLQDFWQQHQNLQQLKDRQENLGQICQTQATQTVKKFYHQLGLYQEKFIELETLRISQLLQKWLEIELERDDFSIYEIEKTHTLFIDKLKLRLRVDRVDQLHNGNLVIIDYKTGSVSETQWLKDEFTEPQLPIYCLLFPNKVVALAFVSLKPDNMKFKGIAVETMTLPGMTKQRDISKAINAFIEKYATDKTELQSSKTITLQEMFYLQQAWGNKIHDIARSFIAGDNLPQPVDNQVCDFCLRQSLCRIYELRN